MSPNWDDGHANIKHEHMYHSLDIQVYTYPQGNRRERERESEREREREREDTHNRKVYPTDLIP